MKSLFVGAALALIVQQTKIDQPLGTVDGVVVDQKTDQSLGGTKITLLPEGQLQGSVLFTNPAMKTTNTDSQGHFVITDVMPGRYRLFPERNGFVYAYPSGVKVARDPGVWIQISPGQAISGIQLKMIPKAVISGRVLDSSGNAAPFGSASVSLMRYSYDEYGQKKLAWVPGITYPQAAGSFVRMNDKGEYRFYDLPAGDYYIRVNGGPYSTPTSPKVNVPFFYPGVTDENKAETIHVNEGDEIQLGTMAFQQTDAVAVRFRFTDVDGIPPTSRAIYFGAGAYNFTSAPKELTLPLARGHYDLVITSTGSSARVSLDVGGSDIVQDVVMSRGIQVKAHLFLEDGTGNRKAYRPENTEFKCRMRSLSTQAISACIGRNGEYDFAIGTGAGYGAIPAIPPDSYQLEFAQLPPGMFVRSATISGHDVLRETIRAFNDFDMDILLSESKAFINGVVRDPAGEKLSDAIIALVPDGSLRSASDLYQMVISDVNGEFQIRGIAPGNYHLFAWSDLEGAAYRNSEFMKEYDDKGIPLKIENSSRITQDLRTQ